jgi:hypothetical protein
MTISEKAKMNGIRRRLKLEYEAHIGKARNGENPDANRAAAVAYLDCYKMLFFNNDISTEIAQALIEHKGND